MLTDSNRKLIENPHFKLLSFLVSSARGCVDEPVLYGSLRLIDAAARLMDIMEEEGLINDDLIRLRELIKEKMNLIMHDEASFVEFLDYISQELARIVKKANSERTN
ncbi:MAG: DUF6092 family protein [Candidatus Methanodesulfokora sp.]